MGHQERNDDDRRAPRAGDPAGERHPLGDVHDYLDERLPREPRALFEAHVAGCEDCRIYTAQLRRTIDVLRGAGSSMAGDASASRPEGAEEVRFADINLSLLDLARAIDRPHAEDIVQSTWAASFASSTRIPCYDALVDTLVEVARRHREDDATSPTVSLADALGPAQQDPYDLTLDPDADRAELYLADLYQDDGLGEGTWRRGPQRWPAPPAVLEPEDFESARELFDVVERLLEELPEDLADLLAAVDIQGHGSDVIAAASGREESDVRRDLGRARDQVRAKLDAYLRG
ncbi:MAG: zf-HC2 domain-containing protein [Marmoricola sp.]